MPIQVVAPSRRIFLKSATALSASAAWALHRGVALAAEPLDANFIALLSDTHIAANPGESVRGTNMSDNLNLVIAQIGKLPQRPANLLINGDCAYLKGLPGDYQTLSHCLQPLAALGIDVHLTMGNHDDRPKLYEVLTGQRPATSVVSNKHLSVVEGEFANWFLLDSLSQVNVVTGELGNEQLKWLDDALDAHTAKPAVVMVHHNPQFNAPESGKPWGGISDTATLFEVLDARPHVRAFIFGHTHTWRVTDRKHMKLINLPPVAYVFGAGEPNGWVSARLDQRGMRLQLHAFDAKHSKAEEIVEVMWQA